MTHATPLDLLDDLLARAKAAGADDADAVMSRGTSISVAHRLGALENLDRAEGVDLGLRVFKGKRQAIVSSSDVSSDALDELVERAVAMARTAPEDPYCGIATPDQIGAAAADLDICAAAEVPVETLKAWAAEAEDAARAVSGVTNSEGAEASYGKYEIALAISNGFTGAYQGSSCGVSASVLAGENTGMERDWDFTSAIHAEDLRAAADVGREAGERAVRRLNPRKVDTASLPVIFDPRVSAGLVRNFAGAVNGVSVARGTSFLKDSLGAPVFAAGIAIIDDPHRIRGMRSKPFDAEGIANGRRAMIEDGRLTGWFLDLSSARQLGLTTTGNAARGTGGPPSPAATNLYMAPGAVSRADLIGGIDRGLLITEMMGFGVNMVTGDYSRGAAGFWIENGELTFPVSELTVAGNLKDMFLNMTPADDLEFRFGTDAPSLRVDGMTVAGK